MTRTNPNTSSLSACVEQGSRCSLRGEVASLPSAPESSRGAETEEKRRKPRKHYTKNPVGRCGQLKKKKKVVGTVPPGGLYWRTAEESQKGSRVAVRVILPPLKRLLLRLRTTVTLSPAPVDSTSRETGTKTLGVKLAMPLRVC